MTEGEVSKSQIDRLGDRLRGGGSSDDLHLLNNYRRSFIEPYNEVVKKIQNELKLEPTGRIPKTVTSILGKLRRQHVRLSQMQDIAGCRLVVQSLSRQELVVAQLKNLFAKVTIDDRTLNPSHGYRAIHVIAEESGKLIEIQVRTELQNNWAQFSEKVSDVLDPDIKYGGGDSEVVSLLSSLSEITMGFEIAFETHDYDEMVKNSQRLLDSFELLNKVILRAKEIEGDISN
jgi:ppGpp synthetase/RelA/SpoT-type nucleotidyltranferase